MKAFYNAEGDGKLTVVCDVPPPPLACLRSVSAVYSSAQRLLPCTWSGSHVIWPTRSREVRGPWSVVRGPHRTAHYGPAVHVHVRVLVLEPGLDAAQGATGRYQIDCGIGLGGVCVLQSASNFALH